MPKNIIICCDGTGNEYGENNTNVVKTFQALVCDDRQIAFYDPGVGTFSILGDTLGKKAGYLTGLAFGWGLSDMLEDAYYYLMEHYEQGDRLYLFGFSRGAFAVRALAGMLLKVGLLQKGSNNLIEYATKTYHTRDNDKIAEGFKRTYCRECPPYFIGVWDTVGSLGLWYGKRFFDQKLNDQVTFGYHAISIDEKRKKFPVSLWDENDISSGQTIKQVWFAGVHSDVGGSYKECCLSDIALMWLLENAQSTGMILRESWKKDLTTDAADIESQHESRKGLWKAWPPVSRNIPDNSLIHQSVIDRINAGIGYQPKNLPENHRTEPYRHELD